MPIILAVLILILLEKEAPIILFPLIIVSAIVLILILLEKEAPKTAKRFP